MRFPWLICATLVVALAGTARSGTIATFSGADPGAGVGASHPGSDAAASSFLAASSTSLITLESAPSGNFTTLNIASGVTATLAGTDATSGILNDNSNSALGFNTTPGGTQFLRIVPSTTGDASVTFSFANPISAFGFYLTGAESTINGALSLRFNDGTSQNLTISKNATAGVQFFGFTDLGATFTSITLVETGPFTSSRDIIGIDDIRFGGVLQPAAVPEPTSLVMGGTALLFGLGLNHRRRRMTAA